MFACLTRYTTATVMGPSNGYPKRVMSDRFSVLVNVCNVLFAPYTSDIDGVCIAIDGDIGASCIVVDTEINSLESCPMIGDLPRINLDIFFLNFKTEIKSLNEVVTGSLGFFGDGGKMRKRGGKPKEGR